jgi:hypothetical protein
MSSKPGPIIVELSDVSERNPLLTAAKKLRNLDNFKGVFISPDLTEAERYLNYQLRMKRNELNNNIDLKTSPFRYGIRSSGVVKLKNMQTVT